MLNIPKEVKDLFKKDSVRKNIRVHFPNGERADITNSNLIAESFSFTESVMSQSEFRFGLCEASMVEFECFGVENIKGYEIEVSHEIDISSLDEEFISTYGMESDDVAFPYYRVPYGKFTVDEALRQADMVRRKITAYGLILDSTQLNNVEMAKKEIGFSKKYNYKLDLYKYMYAGMPNNFKVENATYEDAGLYGEEQYGTFLETPYGLLGIARIEYEVSSTIGENDSSELYYIKLGELLKKEEIVKQELEIYLEEKYPNSKDTIMNLYENHKKEYFLPNITFTADSPGGSQVFLENNYYVYPYIPKGYFGIRVPVGIQLMDGTNANYTVIKSFVFRNSENTQIQKVNADFPQYTLSYSMKKRKDGYYYINDEMETNPYDVAVSLLELKGKFGRYNRNGYFEEFSISNNMGLYPSEDLYPSETLYPREASGGILTKGNYLSAWYDDEYTKPYDRVSVSYKNADGEEMYAEYLIVDIKSDAYNARNYQAYSLSENYLIQNGTFTEAQITEILKTVGEALRNIRYMSCEIDAVGMPWVEAGDGLEIVTNNGAFDTLVLNRRINGIQRLIDNIEAN